MSTRSSSDINRFFAHTGLYQIASCLAAAFIVAFMLHQGVSIPVIFLATAAVHLLRFAFRPLVIVITKAMGLRGALILATCASSAQYFALSQVEGIDLWLFGWVLTTAGADCLYWTLFHVVFNSVADGAKLGEQVSKRQLIAAAANILGPTVGGLLLTFAPTIVVFLVAGLSRFVAALPLMGIDLPPIEMEAPKNAYEHGRFGALVFFTDGWVLSSAGISWAIITFLGLGGRFDNLGLALAAAGFVGALGGFALGKAVDLGHGSFAVLLNLAAMTAIYLSQAIFGYQPTPIVIVMIVGALIGGLGTPTMMAAIYAEGKNAPCSLRYQFAAEGGWDAGAVAVCLTCALLSRLGASPHALILLAVPMLFAQAWLLIGNYRARAQAAPAE